MSAVIWQPELNTRNMHCVTRDSEQILLGMRDELLVLCTFAFNKPLSFC